MKSCYYIHLDKANLAIADLADYYSCGRILTRLSVPEGWRGQGYGSKLLKMILSEADAEQSLLFLEIAPSGGLSYEQLEAWYRKYGFRYRFGLWIRKPRGKEDYKLRITYDPQNEDRIELLSPEQVAAFRASKENK